jgi:prevent-host-death family protein
MRSVPVVEAKAQFSALLAEVEAGAEIAVTRHGKIVARLMPVCRESAGVVFRSIWPDAEEVDLVAPDDPPAEPVGSWDD